MVGTALGVVSAAPCEGGLNFSERKRMGNKMSRFHNSMIPQLQAIAYHERESGTSCARYPKTDDTLIDNENAWLRTTTSLGLQSQHRDLLFEP